MVNADFEAGADVLINEGLIERVDQGIEAPPRCTILNANGKLVMPGGIDPHTHLSMPFMGTTAVDDYFSGQAAALAGGTTMHIDFALPVDGDLQAGLASYRELAKISCMDYGFHMAITTWNDKVARDMGEMAAAGINSFKFFLAYKGALMVTDEQFLEGLRRCKALGALAMVHAENGDAVAAGQQAMADAGVLGPEGHALSRPSVLEAEATARAIRLASFVNTPLYVVHVMSADAMLEVARARKRGQRVIGEPVASGLAFNESRLWDPDFKIAAQYVMSPPIRSEQDRQSLKRALAGGALQLVATDHAVFNSTQKAFGATDFRKIPNGVNGLEERLHVVWQEMVVSGMMTAMDFVRVTSTEAAKTFNLYPRKGAVMPGADADVIIFDPHRRHTVSASTHHSRMDTNIYEGMEFTGKVETTISRGRLVWHNNKLNVKPGTGRYVEMPLFGPLFTGLDVQDAARLQLAYGPVPVSRQPFGGRDEL